MRSTNRLGEAAVAALLAAAISGGAAVPARAEAERGGLVEGGDSPGLLLLYTGDVIGYVDPCG